MRRLVGMKLLVVLGFAALALGQTDDQGSGPRDVPRRGSSSSDGAKDVDVAVPPEIEKQFAGLVGQAQVNGRNNRGGNRLLEEEGAAADKQFAGLVGQAQVNGRNDRNKETVVEPPAEADRQFAGLVGQAQVNGRNNRGGNRLLDEEGAETKAAGEANKQFAGLVGQAQVNGRNNRGNNLRGR